MIGEAELYVGLGATDIFFNWDSVVGRYRGLVDYAVTSAVTIVRERARVPAVTPFGGAGFGFSVENGLVV